jgi:hypothetical protein
MFWRGYQLHVPLDASDLAGLPEELSKPLNHYVGKIKRLDCVLDYQACSICDPMLINRGA